MSRLSVGRKDVAPRRRRQLVIKEKNISADEFMAASIGDVEWLDQSLRDGRNPSSFDKNGLAPIHLAALHGRLSCLQLLIEKYEVDVNLTSSTGWSALHLCINRESGSRALKCLNYLLEKEADVDCQNDDRVTSVHQAASEGLLECLKQLLEYEVDLSIKDVRGHLPVDLARLWGHKNCARLIRTEMWKREKEQKAEELKQLKVVKEYYSELQKEAVHQLKNEQEFYGGVAFGNWLADKNLPENLKEMSSFPRERYPDEATKGLSKRLRTSGGLEDCAQRLEKTNARQTDKTDKKQTKLTSKSGTVTSLSKPNSKSPTKVVQTKEVEKRGGEAVKTGKIRRKTTFQPKQVEKFEKSEQGVREERTDTLREVWEIGHAITPFSEVSGVTATDRRGGRTPWNYSTNPNSDPITDIKYKDTVSLGIHPDEGEAVLPRHANLSVQLDMTKRPKIKVTMPGGRVQSADIRMPVLPSHLIHEVLSGVSSDRIRIPQEFKAVHVYDLKKKRQPEAKPKDEVGMHLSILGDPRLLRKSMSSMTNSTTSPLTTLSNENSLPLLFQNNNYNRMLDTLHRISPPKAFLA